MAKRPGFFRGLAAKLQRKRTASPSLNLPTIKPSRLGLFPAKPSALPNATPSTAKPNPARDPKRDSLLSPTKEERELLAQFIRETEPQRKRMAVFERHEKALDAQVNALLPIGAHDPAFVKAVETNLKKENPAAVFKRMARAALQGKEIERWKKAYSVAREANQQASARQATPQEAREAVAHAFATVFTQMIIQKQWPE